MKIYEYQPTMMHAKTMVADGIWSYIGSMNFDNRSLSFNNESPAVGARPADRRANGFDLHGRPQVVQGDKARRVPKAAAVGQDSRVGSAEAAARSLAARRASSMARDVTSRASMLARFHPIVRKWFKETFGKPSDPQRKGWPAIASGAHTLDSRADRNGKNARGVSVGAERADRTRARRSRCRTPCICSTSRRSRR